MMWDYLKTERYDFRLKILAAYLQGKTAGKTVVDLNCGWARLLNFISHDFELYYGNDNQESFIKESGYLDAKNVLLEVVDDTKVAGRISKIDILLLLGGFAKMISGSDFESENDGDVFFNLTDKFHPEIAVVEIIDEVYRRMEMVIKEKMVRFGYVLDYEIALGLPPYDGMMTKRCLLIFKKM